ncbi:MAG TPA: orotidine-5'-phosphate decarboxylase [Terriglobales bacterium]|nr:orotidine-5'-phosphate decarboxylase [Terriglobales bacterium]
MQARERLILALDVPDAATALDWVRRLGTKVGLVKIGLELFVAAGPDLVRRVRDVGVGVFLDLKLHDIPNTVAGAVRAAARLDVQMLTVHAAGGAQMLAAAAAAAKEAGPGAPRLLAVTVLTSLEADDLAALGIAGPPATRVLAWAGLAQRQAIGGIVASALEAAALRQAFPKLTLVIPGIRPAGAVVGDQARVATPAQAVRAGADYLVLGRAVTAARDPEAALAAVIAEIGAGIESAAP